MEEHVLATRYGCWGANTTDGDGDGDNAPRSSFSSPKPRLGDLQTGFASILPQEGVTQGGNKLNLTWARAAPRCRQPAPPYAEDDSTSSILVVPESMLAFIANRRTIVELQKLLTLDTSEKASEIQSFD